MSGGKDSTRQAIYARDQLGLNPLLVSTVYPPEFVTHIGVKNLENLTMMGFDTISMCPNPYAYKQLVRKSFFDYGNIYKASESVLFAGAQRIATAYKIPLVVLGENGSIVYGDYASQKDGGNAKNLKNINTLQGGDVRWMVDEKLEIKSQDLLMYTFPNVDYEDQLKVIYLGYYIKDFCQLVNGLYSMVYGLQYKTDDLRGRGTPYLFSQNDTDFVPVNQILKFVKFGFAKGGEDLSELVKLGVITRETAIELSHQVDGKCADFYVENFCSYLNITTQEFWTVVEKFRNPEIWKKVNDEWTLKEPLLRSMF